MSISQHLILLFQERTFIPSKQKNLSHVHQRNKIERVLLVKMTEWRMLMDKWQEIKTTETPKHNIKYFPKPDFPHLWIRSEVAPQTTTTTNSTHEISGQFKRRLKANQDKKTSTSIPIVNKSSTDVSFISEEGLLKLGFYSFYFK